MIETIISGPSSVLLALEGMPSWLAVTSAVLFGAVIASLCGVAAERLPHQLGIAEEPEPGLSIAYPPSRCDACRRPLDTLSIVPVIGFLVRRGRCPCASVRVSPVYPLIEGVTAAISGLIAWKFGLGPVGLSLLVLTWAGLALAWTDYLHQVLPEVITIPLTWAGLLLSPFEADPYARIVGAFTGFIVMWFAFKAASLARGERLFSGGDLALAAAGGAWVGIQHLPLFIGAASIIFILEAAPLRRKGVVMVPFGPAIAAALLVAACWAGLGLNPIG
ncbi:leader peptidase (prepilin peptidase)/N-methyltransferase [Bradyrhizobium sp. USDA 4341]